MLFGAGAMHFCNIPGMVAAPRVLGWKEDLANIKPINRNIFIVLCGGIMITILGTGVVVMANSKSLLDGSRLSSSLCFFLSVLWAYRFLIQAVLYSKIWPKGFVARLSHGGLLALFFCLTAVYAVATAINFS